MPFLRMLDFVCALSDFDWFPNLAADRFLRSDTFELVFFMDAFDSVLGKLALELFRFMFGVIGLVDGLCDADLVWCLVCPLPSLVFPGPNFDSLFRPLP